MDELRLNTRPGPKIAPSLDYNQCNLMTREGIGCEARSYALDFFFIANVLFAKMVQMGGKLPKLQEKW